MARGSRRPRGEPRDQRRTRASRRPDTPPALQPLAAALLALRDRPHLLGQTELVRRHEQVPRAAAGRERDDRLAPRAHPRRPLRQLAGQQRGLGVIARPLLGYAAADLALSRRPLHVRGVVGRTVRARGTRPRRPRSAPARHRRGRRAVSHLREGGPPGRAGHRRVVRRRVDARGPGRLPARRGQRRGDAVPGAAHRRGDRPDARLVLHAARGEHPGLRRQGLRTRAVPRSHRGRERQEDEQVDRQRDRPVGRA